MADEPALAEVVAALGAAPVYAIDTEFHRERTYWPELALVQVAWPDGVALVDPLAVDVRPLGAVLAGPGLAVAHAADQDLEVLERSCGARPRVVFDTQLAARFLGFTSTSLATLVDRLLGVHLPKGDRLTDWLRRPLTPAQQAYAASDVSHLLELHRVLVERLEAKGRLAWVEEECEAALASAAGRVDPDVAWWRVKEARSLRGKTRGVAQAVSAWRERRAMQVDQPVRFVLPDLALMSIAQGAPTTAAALRQVRGLQGRGPLSPGAERDLLAAVAEGLSMPPERLRLPPSDELDRPLRPAAALVSAWLGQRATELEIDATLLATRADVIAFLRGDEGARLAEGWRAPIVGRPIRRLVAGDLALAFDGKGGLVLEERSHRPATLDGD